MPGVSTVDAPTQLGDSRVLREGPSPEGLRKSTPTAGRGSTLTNFNNSLKSALPDRGALTPVAAGIKTRMVELGPASPGAPLRTPQRTFVAANHLDSHGPLPVATRTQREFGPLPNPYRIITGSTKIPITPE